MKVYICRTSDRFNGKILETNSLERTCNAIILEENTGKVYSNPEIIIYKPNHMYAYVTGNKHDIDLQNVCDWVLEVYDDWRE